MYDSAATDRGLRKRLPAPKKRVDECVPKNCRRRRDGHASGLVDGDNVVVFVKHIERIDSASGAESAGTRMGPHGDDFTAKKFSGKDFAAFPLTKDNPPS